jgi:hypothetical protein
MAEPRKKGLISHGIASQNRKARFDYKIGQEIEAGVAHCTRPILLMACPLEECPLGAAGPQGHGVDTAFHHQCLKFRNFGATVEHTVEVDAHGTHGIGRGCG